MSNGHCLSARSAVIDGDKVAIVENKFWVRALEAHRRKSGHASKKLTSRERAHRSSRRAMYQVSAFACRIYHHSLKPIHDDNWMANASASAAATQPSCFAFSQSRSRAAVGLEALDTHPGLLRCD